MFCSDNIPQVRWLLYFMYYDTKRYHQREMDHFQIMTCMSVHFYDNFLFDIPN